MCGSCGSRPGFLYLVCGFARSVPEGLSGAAPFPRRTTRRLRLNWVARGNAMTKIMSPEELEQELRAIGAERYHDKHPFHKLLHGGELNKGQVQAWALNRYCYQSAVPRKDAALISRCQDREIRRDWVHRILDHDGYGEEEGGIERWLVLDRKSVV